MVNCLHDAKVQEQRQKAVRYYPTLYRCVTNIFVVKAAKIQPIEEKKEAVRTKRADKVDLKKQKLVSVVHLLGFIAPLTVS